MGMMKTRVREISSGLGKISKDSPKQMEAWQHFMAIIEKDGALSPRRKELIAIALSVCAKCEWCIAFHVKKALQIGATRQEIMESAWMAILMGGGPALMYTQLVEQALDDFYYVGEDEEFQTAQAQLAIDSDFKKLYFKLEEYAKRICNIAEDMCHGKEDRMRLALNIAETDGSVLERLVKKEIKSREWKELTIDTEKDSNNLDPLHIYQDLIADML